MSLSSALEVSLGESDLVERFPASVELARKLAKDLDEMDRTDPKILAPLGRLYMNVLSQLTLMPAKETKGGVQPNELPVNPLQAVRDAARERRAATVPPTAS